MKTVRNASFLLVFAFCPSLVAQKPSVSRSNQYWVQYYNKTTLSKHWSVLIDGGFRWAESLAHNSQYVARIALSRRLGTQFNAAAGFAHLGFYSNENLLNRLEFRPYVELGMTNSPGKLKLAHRYRVESRNFTSVNNGEMPVSKSHNLRYRYRLMASLPISQSVSFHIGEEIFLNSGKGIVYNFFDQNRLTLGPSFQANKAWTFDFILNVNYLSTSTAKTYRQNYVFWLAIRHKLDLSKKNKK